MNDIEKNNENVSQNKTNSSYINERVVVKPHRRILRYLKKIIITIPLAIVFGVIACVVFVYLRPVLEKQINPVEEETTTSEPVTEETTTGEEETEKVFTADDLKELYGQISDITAEMKKSFVTINAYDGEREIFQTAENEIISSGIIIKKDTELHILVMYENVVDMDIIKIIFEDDSSVEATILDYDDITGIAVLKADIGDINSATLSDIKVTSIADSEFISYTEPIVYIGNPFGMDVYEAIGFLNGAASIATGMDIGYGVFRTDIFISECNDGFIFDLEGNLLGVVNGGEKIVEAMAASDIEHIIKGLNNGSGIVYMGINGEAVTDEIREISGINMPSGVYVTNVEKDSPAYVSGIRKGDIIARIDGKVIEDMTNLKTCLKNNKTGNTLSVVVRRQNGEEFDTYTLEVELSSR